MGETSLFKRREVTIAKLRREAPDYTWRAVRTGFGGYAYHGTCGFRWANVYASASMCGDGDDDFVTSWHVDDGRETLAYSRWWLSLDSTIRAEVASVLGGEPAPERGGGEAA